VNAICYATATTRHLLVAVFQKKPTSRRAEATVVVGSATVEASKEEPHVSASADPLSVIEIRSVSPSTGVPVRFVVNEVYYVIAVSIYGRCT
jgi:hypothetical protein